MAELCFRVTSMAQDSAGAITAALRRLSGVSGVELDLHTRWVIVIGDRLDSTAIREALRKAGHNPEL